MKVSFGLYLDGLKPIPPRNVAGTVVVGPKGLLELLETQLGLSTSYAHPSQASFSYLQCLREVSSPDRFFHRSLEIDPVNVARALLDWREQWYEAGWDGTFPTGAPARLADMAAVERIARGRVPFTDGQRLQRVTEALARRNTQIEQLEIHTPLHELPYVWQKVIGALSWAPASGLKLVPAGRVNSDLALVQTILLANLDSGAGQIVQPTPLQGDGSLIVLKSSSKDLSADAVSEFLLANGQLESTVLVAEGGGIILDNALERAGLPRCGFQRFSRFRTATQVLKLCLALLWNPPDPRRILQFLLHPTGPIPRWARSLLADALAESPGIGGPAWTRALDRIGEAQRRNSRADEGAVEELQAEIAYWLEGERHDPSTGVCLEALEIRTRRVSGWATAQVHANKGGPEAALFAASREQADALLAELAVLRIEGRETIDRLSLERRIDEVMTEAPDPSTYEDAGHARATSAPAALTRPWPTVVWWNLASRPTATSHPWLQCEMSALRESGVRLPDTEDQIRWQSLGWLRPICSAQEKLVLVVHDDERGAHPVWTQIESLFTGIRKVEVEHSLLAGQTKLEPLAIPTRQLPLRSLPAPRRWWSLPANYVLARPDVESYSSLSKLCDYPYQWVLQYAAGLRSGRAAEILDGSRLFGNIGHRMIETFFRTNENWQHLQNEDVLKWVRAELPGIIEREGAVLLAPGRGMDRQRVAATLERSLVRLLEHFRTAGVEQVTPEATGEVQFDERRLTGAIDLVLSRGDRQDVVLDIKWASQSYRRDLLVENRALQLATYSHLRKNLESTEAWPIGAFFILSTGNVLAAEGAFLPGAILSTSRDGESISDTWHRLLRTYDWRWTQLADGHIEVVTENTQPDDRSLPPNEALRPANVADQYDDFLHLTGWEDSR